MKTEKIPLEGHLKELFELWLKEKKENLDEDSDYDREICESIFVSDFYAQLGDFQKYLATNYKNQLRKKDKWYPKNWMLKDDIISSLLNKYRISDVLNALETKRYNHRSKKYEYIYLTSPEDYPKEYRNYLSKYKFAFFVVDADFYKTILPGLEMAQITLQKYLAALCKTDVLRLLEKDGRYHKPIYAIGYFSVHKARPKLNRFLTEKNKYGLKRFTL